MASNAAADETIWPMRTWVLAVLGALVALSLDQLADPGDLALEWQRRVVAALPVLLGVTAIAFGLSWHRRRLVSSVLVAVVCGLIAGGVFLWNGVPNGGSSTSLWHLVCGTAAAGFLLTLFQSAQDRSLAGEAPARPAGISPSAVRGWTREAIHYPDIHGHLWTNALLLAASALFMLLSFGIAHLLAEMFMLVKLDFLRVALRQSAIVALLLGAAFGAALGLLRDRGGVITALQRVAMLVLRVLAPVVALGVGVFLAALPVTGLDPLWETGGTTPIMLVGAMLALLLLNSVVGDTPEDESRSVLLSASAAALGIFLLPMVGIAVFSTGLRIQQHGLSPERLWALAFLVAASITAIAYAVAILGPRGWFARVRRTNRSLVFLLALMALLLSTPIFSFERIATAQQLARLAGGQVSADQFDYKALWFDFGPPGRAAIERLAVDSSDPVIRSNAAETRKLTNRWAMTPGETKWRSGTPLDERLTILPEPVALEEGLRALLIRYGACAESGHCLVRYVPGEDVAIVVREQPECEECGPQISLLHRENGGWSDNIDVVPQGETAELAAAVRAGEVEVRPVERRQIYIGGKPVGQNLPSAANPAEAPVAP